MPPASVHDGNTAGLPAARETRTRGLVVCEMIADTSGNGGASITTWPAGMDTSKGQRRYRGYIWREDAREQWQRFVGSTLFARPFWLDLRATSPKGLRPLRKPV